MKRFFLLLSVWMFTVICPNLTFAEMRFSEQPNVQLFIDQMVKKHQFNKKHLATIFDTIVVRPKVIQSIKHPLEKKPWYSYQMLFVTDWRIREGVEFWKKYEAALTRAEKKYGVPASIIVATIGVETKYGKNTGDYRVIDALANIGFSDSPRAGFFRSELEQFLLLSREQHLDPLKIMGSYAGAIGQPQFMPSSYRNYAVNFSGSGKIDLSHNEVDVIGSIANYYSKHGWKTDQPVAIPASLKGGKYQLQLFSRVRNLSSSEIAASGLYPNNINLTANKFQLLQLQGYYGNEYWLGFHNFKVIKRYNSSDLYAMAVYQLSYYINSLREKQHAV